LLINCGHVLKFTIHGTVTDSLPLGDADDGSFVGDANPSPKTSAA
jgi:hypothetical protein